MKKQETKKESRDWGIIQKKDKNGNVTWYARITRIDGKGNKKQFTAKAESKSHARRLRDELTDNFTDYGERGVEGSKMTFRELAEDYKERKLIPAKYHQNRKIAGLRSHRTAKNFLNYLLEYFGTKRIKDITPSDIEKFKQKRLDKDIVTMKKDEKGILQPISRPRAIASVNRELALLRAILNDAVGNGWLIRSPFLNVKGLISLSDEVKRERVLTFDEESRLLGVCSNQVSYKYQINGKEVSVNTKSNREHLKPILIGALDTAMRQGELFKLQWKDVDFVNRTIHILAFNTKTAKARKVGITNRLLEELIRLWENSPQNKEDLVFGIKDTVKRSFASACRDANIEGFHFHDCRHTAITRMIQAGLSPMEIMKISGHTQMNTFARYVNPNTEAVNRIADVLSAYQQHNSNNTIEINSII